MSHDSSGDGDSMRPATVSAPLPGASELLAASLQLPDIEVVGLWKKKDETKQLQLDTSISKKKKHPKANSDCDHFIGCLHHRPFEIMQHHV